VEDRNVGVTGRSFLTDET